MASMPYWEGIAILVWNIIFKTADEVWNDMRGTENI